MSEIQQPLLPCPSEESPRRVSACRSPGPGGSDETFKRVSMSVSPGPCGAISLKVQKIPCAGANGGAKCGGPCGLVALAKEATCTAERVATRRRLSLAIILSIAFMVIEIVGGVFSNSLAIMTDAAHLLSDVASFAISLFALWMAEWEATPRHSYGYHRMEILGALISMQLIWMITGALLVEAVQRLLSQEHQVDGRLMFVTAAFGVLVNVVLSLLLGHHHSHGGHDHDHDHGHGHDHGHNHGHVHGHGHDHRDDDDHHHGHGDNQGHGHDDDDDHDHKHEHKGEEKCGHEQEQSLLSANQSAALRASRHNHTHGSENAQGGAVECSRDVKVVAGCPAVRHRHPVESSHGDQDTAPIWPEGSESCICVVVSEDEEAGERRKERNINLQGAYLHALGDLIQSLGVMVGGALIWYNPEWKIVDLICTLLFSALVLGTTFRMLRDVLDVLMESTPRHIDAGQVLEGMKKLPGVLDVHELHIWAITLGKVVLACHVQLAPGASADGVLRRVLGFCQTKYGITHATIQVEGAHVE